MNRLLYTLILLASVMLFSCETDIDVNAPYEDITVVYGVVNPADSNHYIKINKAFLGDVNALDLAADANNFNYTADEIEITVEEVNNSNVIKTFSTGAGTVVRTVNEIPKDAGVFDNTDNVLYKFVEPNINIANDYRIKIVNKETGKEVSSETEIVGTSYIAFPASSNSNFKFYIVSGSSGNFFDDTKIGITTGNSVGRGKATLVFNYIEHYTTASMKPSVAKSVEMYLGEEVASSSLGDESLEWGIAGSTFFTNIQSAVALPSEVADFSHRELDNISVKFEVSGAELSTYIAVTAPSNTVNQDKPNYTNITNGIGVFSSEGELTYISSRIPANGFVNVSPNTITHLQSLGLGFCFGLPSPTSSYECNQL